jgi:hypothetical protein
MRRRLMLTVASLFALAVLPQAAFADGAAQQGQSPVVLEAANKPYYYVVPPSTDPEPVHTAVMGTAVVRGTVLYGTGDLLLLDLGADDQAVVRLPTSGNTRLPGEAVAPGSLVEAAGVPTAAGVLESLRVTIWMP